MQLDGQGSLAPNEIARRAGILGVEVAGRGAQPLERRKQGPARAKADAVDQRADGDLSAGAVVDSEQRTLERDGDVQASSGIGSG